MLPEIWQLVVEYAVGHAMTKRRDMRADDWLILARLDRVSKDVRARLMGPLWRRLYYTLVSPSARRRRAAPTTVDGWRWAVLLLCGRVLPPVCVVPRVRIDLLMTAYSTPPDLYYFRPDDLHAPLLVGLDRDTWRAAQTIAGAWLLSVMPHKYSAAECARRETIRRFLRLACRGA
jgi:hypothetical protein